MILNGVSGFSIQLGDTLELCRALPDQSVDLVICSPPYENARTYGDKERHSLRGQAWVDHYVERYAEHYRVCRGLVVWVVEGRTQRFAWSATPALLMADLHRRGVKLRKPPIFKRFGVFGGGGREWWRNDYEFCVCASHGRLPWADNTATGHPPKYPPGGDPSHQGKAGRVSGRKYKPPKLANPGNVIECKVGGGHMGSDLAHENEAPFPERLVDAFVRSFCPPGGVVLDGFCGSGTTAAVCVATGRRFIGHEIRQSQIDLTWQRIAEAINKRDRQPLQVGQQGERRPKRKPAEAVLDLERDVCGWKCNADREALTQGDRCPECERERPGDEGELRFYETNNQARKQ